MHAAVVEGPVRLTESLLERLAAIGRREIAKAPRLDDARPGAGLGAGAQVPTLGIGEIVFGAPDEFSGRCRWVRTVRSISPWPNGSPDGGLRLLRGRRAPPAWPDTTRGPIYP